MKIKTFKLFESNLSGRFPDFDEIKEYFYNFTDEIGTSLSDYQIGYQYFFEQTDFPFRISYLDILKTNQSNSRLFLNSDFIIINKEIPEYLPNKKNLLQNFQNEDVKLYDYMAVMLNENLFEEVQLDELIHSLKRLYDETGFRPYGCLWTEDYVSFDDEVVTKLAFEGTFFRGSDEEYVKICQIHPQGNRSKNLTKYFLHAT